LGAEQNIKELKLNYPLAKIPTKSYTANITYFQILLCAYALDWRNLNLYDIPIWNILKH